MEDCMAATTKPPRGAEGETGGNMDGDIGDVLRALRGTLGELEAKVGAPAPKAPEKAHPKGEPPKKRSSSRMAAVRGREVPAVAVHASRASTKETLLLACWLLCGTDDGAATLARFLEILNEARLRRGEEPLGIGDLAR